MKRVAAIGVVLALVGAGSASAQEHLSGTDARKALIRWSLSHGMERAEAKGCKRLAPARLRCQMVETGPWPGGLRAEEVWSLYTVWRTPSGVIVRWEDFVYGPGCTTEPGYENQCPPGVDGY